MRNYKCSTVTTQQHTVQMQNDNILCLCMWLHFKEFEKRELLFFNDLKMILAAFCRKVINNYLYHRCLTCSILGITEKSQILRKGFKTHLHGRVMIFRFAL